MAKKTYVDYKGLEQSAFHIIGEISNLSEIEDREYQEGDVFIVRNNGVYNGMVVYHTNESEESGEAGSWLDISSLEINDESWGTNDVLSAQKTRNLVNTVSIVAYAAQTQAISASGTANNAQYYANQAQQGVNTINTSTIPALQTDIDSRAKQEDLDAVSEKVTANETSINTINNTTIPTLETEIDEKIDKVSGTKDNVVIFGENNTIADSGKICGGETFTSPTITTLATELGVANYVSNYHDSTKADKSAITTLQTALNNKLDTFEGTTNNLPLINNDGKSLTDSGVKIGDESIEVITTYHLTGILKDPSAGEYGYYTDGGTSTQSLDSVYIPSVGDTVYSNFDCTDIIGPVTAVSDPYNIQTYSQYQIQYQIAKFDITIDVDGEEVTITTQAQDMQYVDGWRLSMIVQIISQEVSSDILATEKAVVDYVDNNAVHKQDDLAAGNIIINTIDPNAVTDSSKKIGTDTFDDSLSHAQWKNENQTLKLVYTKGESNTDPNWDGNVYMDAACTGLCGYNATYNDNNTITFHTQSEGDITYERNGYGHYYQDTIVATEAGVVKYIESLGIDPTAMEALVRLVNTMQETINQQQTDINDLKTIVYYYITKEDTTTNG